MKFVKHIHVLHLLSEIPAVRFELRPSPYSNATYSHNVAMTGEEELACWDHIFSYIHSHWADPETASVPCTWPEEPERFTVSERAEIMDCRKMLNMGGAELEEHLATLPPYFGESLFPVAVARYLLRDLCINFDHRKSATFKEFHRRYGTMVMHCIT